MGSWILIAAGNSLKAAFNELAPNRDKASDGSIGDTAHAAGGTSDHLPDEDFSALRGKDADRTNEVHAIDVDDDLREPGVSMEDVVQFLLKRCRAGSEKRLRYIIYNRRIWSASNGWKQQAYSGPSPHTEHAHFSFSYISTLEASTASWHLEELVALSADDKKWLSAEIAKQSKAAVEAYFRISDHNGAPYCSAGNAILSHQIPDGTVNAVNGKYPQKPAWEVFRNIGVVVANIDSKIAVPPAPPAGK